MIIYFVYDKNSITIFIQNNFTIIYQNLNIRYKYIFNIKLILSNNIGCLKSNKQIFKIIMQNVSIDRLCYTVSQKTDISTFHQKIFGLFAICRQKFVFIYTK